LIQLRFRENIIGSIVKMLLFYGKILWFVCERGGLMWVIIGWRGKGR
jgi:hypothetical protein